MQNESSENAERPSQSIRGTVTARQCECCGHHELGIVRETGEYVALRPGMLIDIIQPQE